MGSNEDDEKRWRQIEQMQKTIDHLKLRVENWQSVFADEEITPDVRQWLIRPLERNLACVVSEKDYEGIDDQISPYAQGVEITKRNQLYETKFIIDELRQNTLKSPDEDKFLAPLIHATFLDNNEISARPYRRFGSCYSFSCGSHFRSF